MHSWHCGIFEIKAKISCQNGLWPAIWTLGEGYEWPTGGEIDIMEYYGGNILANAAWASNNRWEALWDDFRKPIDSFGDLEWCENFHIWRMEWTSNEIKIYLDNFLMNSIELDKTNNQRGEIKNPFRETNQFIILNLAIGVLREVILRKLFSPQDSKLTMFASIRNSKFIILRILNLSF